MPSDDGHNDCDALIRPGGVFSNADGVACFAKNPSMRGAIREAQLHPSTTLKNYETEISIHTLGAATADWLHDCKMITDQGHDQFGKDQAMFILSSQDMTDDLALLSPGERAASDAAWAYSAADARKTLKEKDTCDSPNDIATATRALVALSALYNSPQSSNTPEKPIAPDTGSTTLSTTEPIPDQDTKALMDAEDADAAECQTDMSDAGNQSCADRDEMAEQLKAKGWCFHGSGPVNERRWGLCAPKSEAH